MPDSKPNPTTQALRDTMLPLLEKIIALAETCLSKVDNQWTEYMIEDVQAIHDSSSWFLKTLQGVSTFEWTEERHLVFNHELRVPANSIIGYSEVLLEGLDGKLPEQIITEIKTIKSLGQDLLRCLNDLLN